MDVDLERIPSQIGTAILDSDGKVLKVTGDISQNQDVCSTIYKILLDTSKCLDKEPMKRISISFTDHNYVVTVGKNHVYIVKFLSQSS